MWIIDFFLPPKQDSSAAEILQWQWKVTSSLIVILIAGAWIIKNVAWAGDIMQLKSEVSDIKRSINSSALETQLRSIQTELFQLKQKVSEIESKHQPVDPLYYTRISTLESDQYEIRRRLEVMK